MTNTALIRFAPLTTLERVNDPAWKRPGRTMYDHGALTFVPGQTSAPLLVDHDHTREIGVVHTLTRYDDTDGPWLACIAEITDLPCWLRKYETKASFGYKAAGTSHDVFGCEIARRGLIAEVSVLSPGRKPAEPLAKVLTLRPIETSSGEIDGYRPPLWDQLERIVGYAINDANWLDALAQAQRSQLDQAIAARRTEPRVIVRPGIGQVLGVGGVPVGGRR